jgi:hypothetical protein
MFWSNSQLLPVFKYTVQYLPLYGIKVLAEFTGSQVFHDIRFKSQTYSLQLLVQAVSFTIDVEYLAVL